MNFMIIQQINNDLYNNQIRNHQLSKTNQIKIFKSIFIHVKTTHFQRTFRKKSNHFNHDRFIGFGSRYGKETRSNQLPVNFRSGPAKWRTVPPARTDLIKQTILIWDLERKGAADKEEICLKRWLADVRLPREPHQSAERK